MAHGTPDWGVTAGGVTTYQLTDLAELAARLGSPVTHDRRGDVIWWDDFEWGLDKWGFSGVGTGGSLALSRARARNGRYSALLTSPSDNFQLSTMDHVLPFIRISRMGLEYSFSLAGAVGYVRNRMAVYTGSALFLFEVRWRDAENDLVYLDSSGVAVTFATGVSLLVNATLFHTIKLVIDPVTGQYVRVIVDSNAYSLAAIAAQEIADTTLPNLTVVAGVYSGLGTNAQIYADDVIVTINEPA